MYSGEDLPVIDQHGQEPAAKPKAPVTEHPAAAPASAAQIRFIETLIAETGGELAKLLAFFRVNSLQELSAHAASRAISSLKNQRSAA